MRYYKIVNRKHKHRDKWPYAVIVHIDNLIFYLKNTRRLNAVRRYGKSSDILSRDMRFVYYVEQMQENAIDFVMEFPNNCQWQGRHETLIRVDKMFDWIRSNVKCKWSVQFGRLFKKQKLFVKFSFEDISTAVMFKLTF